MFSSFLVIVGWNGWSISRVVPEIMKCDNAEVNFVPITIAPIFFIKSSQGFKFVPIVFTLNFLSTLKKATC